MFCVARWGPSSGKTCARAVRKFCQKMGPNGLQTSVLKQTNQTKKKGPRQVQGRSIHVVNLAAARRCSGAALLAREGLDASNMSPETLFLTVFLLICLLKHLCFL